MSIKSDFKRALLEIEKGSEKIIRATALQLFSAIVNDTPVDTGRLRGNWQTTINGPSNITVQISDKSGKTTKASIGNVINRWEINKSIFMTNNLPYADVIENGDVNRRGHFMVKRAVSSFKTELNKQARRKK